MIGESVYVVRINYAFGADEYIIIDIFSTYGKAVDFMWKTLDEYVYDLDDVTKSAYEKAKSASDSYYTDGYNVRAWVEERTVK